MMAGIRSPIRRQGNLGATRNPRVPPRTASPGRTYHRKRFLATNLAVQNAAITVTVTDGTTAGKIVAKTVRKAEGTTVVKTARKTARKTEGTNEGKTEGTNEGTNERKTERKTARKTARRIAGTTAGKIVAKTVGRNATVTGETNDGEMTASDHALAGIAIARITTRTVRGQNPPERIAQRGAGAASCVYLLTMSLSSSRTRLIGIPTTLK